MWAGGQLSFAVWFLGSDDSVFGTGVLKGLEVTVFSS